MQNELIEGIIEHLNSCGLNAIRAYEKRIFDSEESVICVALSQISITASGLGNYVGLVSENGEVREMYGSSARLKLELDIYAPTHRLCEAEKIRLLEALRECRCMKISGMDFSGTLYDSASNMMKSRCEVNASAMLVRKLHNGELGEYTLGEADYEY